MVEKFVQSGIDYTKDINAEVTPEVPPWMPEKFVREGKPDYKALADSYQEAQQYISGKQPKSEPTPQKEPAKAAPKKGDETNPWSETNLNRWAQEAAENGGVLNEESYAEIPIPRPFVDMWIKTMTERTQGEAAKDVEAFGGQDGWVEVQAWAKANYTQEEKDAFAQAQRVGGPIKKMAIENLKHRYEAEVGSQPTRRVTGDLAGPGAGAPFSTQAQVTKAMSDPRYRIGTSTYDAEYAENVRARVAAMKN